MFWPSTAMYLCSFKDNFSVLDYIQGGRAVTTLCEPHMLETELTSSSECNNPARYFHDSVSKANLVVHNHSSDVVFGKYLLMSLYHILSMLKCIGANAGALWLLLNSRSLEVVLGLNDKNDVILSESLTNVLSH